MTVAALSPGLSDRLAAVDGQIIPEEGLILFELAAAVPNAEIIVEIGAFKGKSSCYLAAGAQAGGGALVYSIDLWTRSPWPAYALPEIPQAWADNVGHLGLEGLAVGVEADTAEAARDIGGLVGLLFVDSDHSYEGVCRDLAAWVHRVGPQGVMAFHDVTAQVWGVKRALEEKLLATGLYTMEVQYGTAIVRRKSL